MSDKFRPPWPEPHTPKWHGLHLQYNDRQARHTMRVVRELGDVEVCGICGDKPSRVVVSLGNAGDAPWPIRICDDCQRIQRERFGSVYREPAVGEIVHDPVAVRVWEVAEVEGPNEWMDMWEVILRAGVAGRELTREESALVERAWWAEMRRVRGR